MLPPDRDAAREAAERELADPVYAANGPSPLERALSWVLARFADLLDLAASAAPGGYGGLLALVALVVLVVVAIRLRLGRIGRAAAGRRPVSPDRTRSADDHRRAADEHAARGEWAEAVRERLRGTVRGLEERGVLDPRAGRTADEVATEAGAVLPGCAADLRAAARVFDAVVYGGRPADPGMDAQLREVDEAVRRARPVAPAPVP